MTYSDGDIQNCIDNFDAGDDAYEIKRAPKILKSLLAEHQQRRVVTDEMVDRFVAVVRARLPSSASAIDEGSRKTIKLALEAALGE